MPSHAFYPPRNPRREIFVSTASVIIRKYVQRRSVTWSRSNTSIHLIFFCEAGLGAQILPYFPQFLVSLMDTLPSYSPSNMAGPTPTIMIDMGSEEACEGRVEWLG